MTVIIQLVVGVEYALGGLDVLTVEWSWDHVPELGMLQQLQQLRVRSSSPCPRSRKSNSFRYFSRLVDNLNP